MEAGDLRAPRPSRRVRPDCALEAAKAAWQITVIEDLDNCLCSNAIATLKVLVGV